MRLAQGVVAAAAVLLSAPTFAKEPEMHHAKGEFEVKLDKISTDQDTLMRMSIDKQFTGDLMASSAGQMMAGGNESNGARVYVALETVTGKLDGKAGSFILAHRGTMTKTGQELSVVVVPDSGTDELTGIKGTLGIDIKDGKHFYTFDYTFPAK